MYSGPVDYRIRSSSAYTMEYLFLTTRYKHQLYNGAPRACLVITATMPVVSIALPELGVNGNQSIEQLVPPPHAGDMVMLVRFRPRDHQAICRIFASRG